MLLDILTGIIKSKINGDLKSSKLRVGFYTKFCMVLFNTMIFGVDFYILKFVDANFNLFIISTTYLCVMEIVSVIENVKIINPRVKKLLDYLRGRKNV